MHYQVEIDRMTSAEWDRLLGLFADASIFQTWSYGAIRWGERNLSHLVLKQHGQVVGMAQLRIIRVPLTRYGIAYLRWGPLCHLRGRELEPEALRGMATALHDEYVERRKLFLRILPNAFVGSARAEAFRGAFFGFKTEPAHGAGSYKTLVLDLAPSSDNLRKQLDQKWRNQLNRAEKNSLRIIEGNSLGEYRLFVAIYREMRARKKFETSVDIDEFGRIQEGLAKNQRMRIVICTQGDTPVAGIVCSAMGDTGIYMLGATSDNGLQAKGAYLLQWTVIKWLKERGFRYYDLGGINPESNPGVFHFKSGLSGKDVCHLDPFIACNNAAGSALVRAAEFLCSRRWGGSNVARQSHGQGPSLGALAQTKDGR